MSTIHQCHLHLSAIFNRQPSCQSQHQVLQAIPTVIEQQRQQHHHPHFREFQFHFAFFSSLCVLV